MNLLLLFYYCTVQAVQNGNLQSVMVKSFQSQYNNFNKLTIITVVKTFELQVEL